MTVDELTQTDNWTDPINVAIDPDSSDPVTMTVVDGHETDSWAQAREEPVGPDPSWLVIEGQLMTQWQTRTVLRRTAQAQPHWRPSWTQPSYCDPLWPVLIDNWRTTDPAQPRIGQLSGPSWPIGSGNWPNPLTGPVDWRYCDPDYWPSYWLTQCDY